MGSLPAAQLLPGSFFGRSRRVAHVSDLILSETHYPSALTVPRHVHERAYFSFLLQGGYCEDLGAGVVAFEPSSVVFHPPREVQRGQIGVRGATLLHAEIPEAWTLRLRDHGGLPRDAVVHRGGPLLRLGMALYRELRADDTGSALIVEGLVLEMLGMLVRLPRRGREGPRAGSTKPWSWCTRSSRGRSPSVGSRTDWASGPCTWRGRPPSPRENRSASAFAGCAWSWPAGCWTRATKTCRAWPSRQGSPTRATSRGRSGG